MKEPVNVMRQRFPLVGKLRYIGLRPKTGELTVVRKAELIAGKGLAGDKAAKKKRGGRRQVSLIQSEHLSLIGRLMGEQKIDPGRLRRNLVVSGINIFALKGQRFRIGDTLLEGTIDCDPCWKMEQELGPGGWNAMAGHGGILAKVIEGGPIRVGDAVQYGSIERDG